MATWNDLSRYVNRKYPVQSEDDTSIRLTYATEGTRSQLVILWLHVPRAQAEARHGARSIEPWRSR